jgi:hypothetical protein
MPTEFIAQDNAAIYENTDIAVTGCPKKAIHRAHATPKR